VCTKLVFGDTGEESIVSQSQQALYRKLKFIELNIAAQL
jgi:hypothetical protein